MSKMQRVVIVGGGAAGLEIVTRLGRSLGSARLAEIILVDPNLSYTWKPLWHEIAAGSIMVNKESVEYLSHGSKCGFKFKLGNLVGLNREIKGIKVEGADYLNRNNLVNGMFQYDYLILALGSIHNDFGTPGADEFCFSFDKESECAAFHESLTRKLIELTQSPEIELNVVIIGGGSTGVELAFEVSSTIAKLSVYKSLLNNNFKINLSIIESGDSILGAMSAELVKECIKILKSAHIKIYTSERVTKLDNEAVYTASGKRLQADIKLWTAGIKAPQVLADLGLAVNGKNQLLIRDTLQVVEDEYIFGVGDCANFSEPERSLPPTAQLAHQQARFLTKSLTDHIRLGRPLAKFNFKKRGTIISTGRKNIAIGEIESDSLGKINLNKRLASFSYRFLYRRYQASLYGWWKTLLLVIADFLSRRVRPKVKLH